MTSLAGFIAELRRRNVLRAGVLYVGAVWALAQGIASLGPVVGAPDWIARWFLVAAAIGFPFWLAFAWFYEFTPIRGSEPHTPVCGSDPLIPGIQQIIAPRHIAPSAAAPGQDESVQCQTLKSSLSVDPPKEFTMRLPVCLALLAVACGASAQDLVVYGDALRNGFVDCYSRGGGTDLLHATTTRNASLYSIAFTGNASNALAFAHENVDFATTHYVGVRFHVHGGTVGGQQLRFQLLNNLGGPPLVNVELDSYIAGGAIAANEWRMVEVLFAGLPLPFVGSFDRFDLQSDHLGTQPTLYLDDIELIAGASPLPFVFSDSFEGACSPGPAGSLRFTMAALVVGEAGGSATIGVERVNGSFGAVALTYATSDGTAMQPSDYASANGALSWAGGEVGLRTFNVAIANDASDEPDETIGLSLSGVTGGASLGAPSTAVLTISDDDPSVAQSFSIDNVSLMEGNTGTTAFTFTVARAGDLSGMATVQVQSADASATAGSDYTALPLTTLTFAPNVATQTTTIEVAGDTTREPTETFAVNLSNPSSGTIADAQGLGSIVNDDPLPQISINNVSLVEGNSGTSPFTFTIQLNNASGQTVTVIAETANGSATSGGAFNDFTSIISTITFPPGVTTQPFSVSVRGDVAVEPDETFFVNLVSPTNGNIADGQGLGTIVNDD